VGPSDPPSWADVVALRSVAREHVRPLPPLPEVAFTAVGGTARALLRLSTGRTRSGALGRDDLERTTGLLVQRRTDRVASRNGVRAERARLLPAGTAILFALIDQLGVEAVEVSQAGIREGLAIALVHHGSRWHDAVNGENRIDAGPAPADIPLTALAP
jgi:exopolyphosphatase/pppGpp-phosphohydrolase